MKRKTKSEHGGKDKKREIKGGEQRERERERELSVCGRTEKDRLKSFKLFFRLNNPSFVQI